MLQLHPPGILRQQAPGSRVGSARGVEWGLHRRGEGLEVHRFPANGELFTSVQKLRTHWLRDVGAKFSGVCISPVEAYHAACCIVGFGRFVSGPGWPVLFSSFMVGLGPWSFPAQPPDRQGQAWPGVFTRLGMR